MEILLAFSSALWLGIMTSLSPCPLTTNIAAVSFLSKRIVHPRQIFISGMVYTLGRVAAYAVLGWIIIASLLSVPQTARFLQKYMVRALGPILFITGLFLLELIKLKLPGVSLSEKQHDKLAASGASGAFLLGVIFALAFCPVSAALFFGSLIPLALASKAGAVLPFIYGVGTGLPVLVFAVLIACGIKTLSHWFHWTLKLEKYTRRITGIIFVLAGAYYTAIYVFRLF